jgi:hypothetical protein
MRILTPMSETTKKMVAAVTTTKLADGRTVVRRGEESWTVRVGAEELVAVLEQGWRVAPYEAK